MEVKATLAPGHNGTKQSLKLYGDQLVCVRHRYDKTRQKRFETIEIIFDEQDWIPSVRFPVHKRVPVKIGFEETGPGEQMKQAGAYWKPGKKAWTLSCRQALEMELEKRIVDDSGLSYLKENRYEKNRRPCIC